MPVILGRQELAFRRSQEAPDNNQMKLTRVPVLALGRAPGPSRLVRELARPNG